MAPPPDDVILKAMITILGENPKSSLLFGAPAISLAHLESLLEIPSSNLDPRRIAEIALPLGESFFSDCRRPERKQLKRADELEEWLVFRPDPQGVKESPSIFAPVDTTTLAPSIRESAGELEDTAPSHIDSAPTLVTSTSSRFKDSYVLPNVFSSLEKPVTFVNSPSQGPIDDSMDFHLPPPHRVNSKLWHEVPLVLNPEPSQSPVQAIFDDFRLKEPVNVNEVVQHSISTSVVAPLSRLDDPVAWLQDPQVEASISNATAGFQEIDDVNIKSTEPYEGPVDEDEDNLAVNDMSPVSAETNTPISNDEDFAEMRRRAFSPQSDVDFPLVRNDQDELPSPGESATSECPTPLVTAALQDLPFSLDLPAFSTLPVAEWLACRWQLILAQLVVLGAAVWILQYSDL